MKLSEIEALADEVIDLDPKLSLGELQAQTVKAMCQLLRQQHEALKSINEAHWLKSQALVDYEEFNK